MNKHIRTIQNFLARGEELHLVRDMTMYKVISIDLDQWARVIKNPLYSPQKGSMRLEAQEIIALAQLCFPQKVSYG